MKGLFVKIGDKRSLFAFFAYIDTLPNLHSGSILTNCIIKHSEEETRNSKIETAIKLKKMLKY